MTSDKTFECFAPLSYPVAVIDNKQTILWANQKFLDLHELKHLPEDAKEKKSLEEQFFSHCKKDEYTLKIETSQHYFQVVTSILAPSEQLSLLSLFDISRRKALQSKLDDKDVMFRNFSEELPDGVILFRSHIIYSNPAFEKFVKYTGMELKKMELFDLIHSSAKEEFIQSLQVPMRKKSNAFEAIIQLKTKNDSVVWAKVKTKVIQFEGQETYLSIISNMVKEQTEIKKLSKMAYYDTLTTIYNRRKFNEVLAEEVQRSKRYNHTLTALFFDIDHFKKINDTYGHDCGDEVLKQLAEEVKNHIRSSDCFARWGGEEFIILLPETSLDNAIKMAEHLRSSIAAVHFDKVPQVTISLGVTALKVTERVNSFLKRLDNALYKAKASGRNCVIAL